MQHDRYLECNGQTFSASKFPKLYKALGTNRVPNYQGVFLRGYGSQRYSQNNGNQIGNTSTNYSSGNLGSIQGDATREFMTWATGLWASNLIHGHPIDNAGSTSRWRWLHNYSLIPKHGIGNTESGHVYRYTYTPESCGENGCSGGSLNERVIDVPYSDYSEWGWVMAHSEAMPTANEIRPINIAVRYFIKAK